jgi:8-oxo-dGTP pyrophosphatase MutT (NUDIX family)
MLFLTTPPNFHPRFDVVGLFLEWNGSILVLRRHLDKPQGGTWGMPAGKTNGDETLQRAMSRENAEETGIRIPENRLELAYTTYVRYPDYDFCYHIFRHRLDGAKPEVRLNPQEHTVYDWRTPREVLELDLTRDFDACIGLCYPDQAIPT